MSTLPRHDHLRADARRNLDRILAAAAEIFAEQGGEASVAAVAERAGVGTATIFRRFPTKDDLLATIIERRFQRLAEDTRRAAAIAEPGEALRQVMLISIAGYVEDRLIAETIGTSLFRRPELHEPWAEVTSSKERALHHAQAAGQVRPDVTLADFSLLLAAIGFVGQRLDTDAPDAWRRCLDIVLDGLRPEVARPLFGAPVVLRHLAALHDSDEAHR
ncbi:MAG: TetR/AcrR family transcriptional regulator [Chloroflexota bacterium]|nr:TetR/AcrR family transcriptional regulator [Chloroflexota bacterium]